MHDIIYGGIKISVDTAPELDLP